MMLFYDDLAEFVTKQTEKLERLKSANIPEVGVILALFGPNDNQDMDADPGLHSVTQPVDRLAIDCHGIGRSASWTHETCHRPGIPAL